MITSSKFAKQPYLILLYGMTLFTLTINVLMGVNEPPPEPCRWEAPEIEKVTEHFPISMIEDAKRLDGLPRPDRVTSSTTLNLMVENAWVNSERLGFPGNIALGPLTNKNRYLNLEIVRSIRIRETINGREHICGNYDESIQRSMDLVTLLETKTARLNGTLNSLNGTTIVSDTVSKRDTTDGDTKIKYTLSNPHTVEDFIARVTAHDPFEGTFPDHSIIGPHYDLTDNQKHLNLRMARFQWRWGADILVEARTAPPLCVVVFFPEDNPATPAVNESLQREVVKTYFWENWKIEQQSPVYEINPHMLKGHVNGRYRVSLLPVDLDIEYASQGGNKELEESKEDTGDGGYISLKSQTHQGEDITPTTYLVIRPTTGLPNDSKVRLKFNSGGRYKVSKNLLGTDLVVSEVTEFPAGQETRLYLVGENKSQSRGGENITMQVKVGGSWIDGDSLKATVVQTQFQIDLRVFIPYNWVNIPHPAHVFQVAKGDSRSYDPDLNGTYRVAQRAIVNLYGEWVPEVENRMIENWKSARVSEHYSNSDVLNWDDGAKHSDDTDVSPSYINSGAAVINSGTADISRVDSFIESVGPTGSSDDTKTFMKFTGAAAEPIIAGAADIDWRIFVGISKNDPLKPQFVMQGVHDGFPAYEIYINSNHQIFQHTNVLQWKPYPAVGVLELIGFPDVTVGTATGLIEQ